MTNQNNIPDGIESALNLFDFELIDLDDKILRGILESHFLDLRISIYKYFDGLDLHQSISDLKKQLSGRIGFNYPKPITDYIGLIDDTNEIVNQFEIELIQTIHTGD